MVNDEACDPVQHSFCHKHDRIVVAGAAGYSCVNVCGWPRRQKLHRDGARLARRCGRFAGRLPACGGAAARAFSAGCLRSGNAVVRSHGGCCGGSSALGAGYPGLCQLCSWTPGPLGYISGPMIHVFSASIHQAHEILDLTGAGSILDMGLKSLGSCVPQMTHRWRVCSL